MFFTCLISNYRIRLIILIRQKAKGCVLETLVSDES